MQYVGVDQSSTMVRRARERLQLFGDRIQLTVRVRLSCLSRDLHLLALVEPQP